MSSCCGGGNNPDQTKQQQPQQQPSGILKNKQVVQQQKSSTNNNKNLNDDADNNNNITRNSGYSGDSILKFVLCGTASVGKTSLTKRFVYGVFNQNLRPTIGVDYLTKTIVADGIVTTLQLFDLQGQDLGGRTKATNQFYYRGSHAIIIVADASAMILNTERTLNEIKNWKADVDEKFLHGGRNNNNSNEDDEEQQTPTKTVVSPTSNNTNKPKVPIILFVNKMDLIETKWEMNTVEELAKGLVEKLGFHSYHLVSAATGALVRESFMEIVDNVRAG